MTEVIFPDIPMMDALQRVTGGIDMAFDRVMPGSAHAKVVRSPIPHGYIRSVDDTGARGAPGVLDVLTGSSLESLAADRFYGDKRKDQPVLAVDKVRYAGEPVALVVAETETQASAASRLVHVEYEDLPYVTDVHEAMTEGAPVLHDAWPDNDCGSWKLRRGKIEQGWKDSYRIYEGVYTSPPANTVPLEPHVSMARFDDGVLEVWTATQSPYLVHGALKKMFGLQDDAVRVRTFNLGGSFGGKAGVKIEPIVACATMVLGRPVRLVLSRAEVFQTVSKHACHVTIRTGVAEDGRIVARRVTAIFDAGAYALSSPSQMAQAMTRAPGPYRIPHAWIDTKAVYTNTVPTGAFRGAMTSQLAWAYEQQIDEIAEDLGIDPVELRRRNLLREGDEYVTGEKMRDAHFVELLDDAAEAIGWGEPSETAEPGHVRGKGIALMIKSTATPSRSEAHLRLTDDGDMTLFCSSVEMGQGASTTLAQIASAYMDLPAERISVAFPDTAVTGFDTYTGSSRATFSMGTAVHGAAGALRQELATLASERFEAAVVDLVFSKGVIHPLGAPGQSISYGALLAAAGRSEIQAEGIFQSEGGMPTLDPETGQGEASIHWHEGAVGVEIDVDLDTGKIKVLDCHGVSYAGRVVSPTRVRQQNEGNIIFGLGQALFEEGIYDSGQLVNPNLADYMIPSILDVPERLTSNAVESEDPDAEIHGVGEMTIPCVAPAIGNALFAATGVRLRSLPMTPEKVLRALLEAVGARQ